MSPLHPAGTLARMADTRDPILILDMATLRFVRPAGRGATRVTTRTGLMLASVHPRAGEADADLAFRCMDAALRTAQVMVIDPATQARRCVHVGLYNPLSGDVAVGATPHTVTFTSGGTVDLDPDGTYGVHDEDELTIAGQTLKQADRGVRELTRTLAHQSAS